MVLAVSALKFPSQPYSILLIIGGLMKLRRKGVGREQWRDPVDVMRCDATSRWNASSGEMMLILSVIRLTM